MAEKAWEVEAFGTAGIHAIKHGKGVGKYSLTVLFSDENSYYYSFCCYKLFLNHFEN
jgi:hypothetical protein